MGFAPNKLLAQKLSPYLSLFAIFFKKGWKSVDQLVRMVNVKAVTPLHQ